MDRNVVTATILIALIMVVWMTWLAPTPPETDQEMPGLTEEPVFAPESEAIRDEPTVLQRSPKFVEGDSTVAGAGEGEERDITVRTSFYTAVFSTRGATLISLELENYTKFGTDVAVQMVDTTMGGALGLEFMSPANRNHDTRSFLFETDFVGDELVVGEAPAELSFTTPVGRGVIHLTYTFTPDSYEIGLSIQQIRPETFSTSAGYSLSWYGGIPFTEGDHENEAQKAGAFTRSGGEVENVMLMGDAYDENSIRGSVDWVAVKNKYFLSAIIPNVPARGAELIGERFGENDSPDVRHDYMASLTMGAATADPDVFRMYIGPMELSRINRYGVDLYDMVDYGWDFFETVTRPLAVYVFIPIFNLLYGFIGSYGWVIIVFSFLIKVALYPLTKKSFRSMARMKELQPRMEAIKEKYRDNPKKQQEATMKMYKETGVNPLGGCLPMLLQYPIIIALWQFLPQAIELRQQSFLWATDLSAPDVILNLPFSIPMFGSAIAGFTVLMGLSMVVQMKMQATPGSGAQQKIFMYVFPVMIFVIFNRLASGLNLYYLCYNVLTAAQQKIINKQLERESKDPKKQAEAKAQKGGKQRKGGQKRSSLSSKAKVKGRPARKGRR